MNDFHRGWKRQKHIFSSLTFLELNRRRHRRRCKKILDVDEDKKTKAAAEKILCTRETASLVKARF